LGKITTGALPADSRYGSEKAVDGKCGNKFITKYGVWPAWLMIDFGEIMTIVKIFIFHSDNSGITRIVMTIGMWSICVLCIYLYSCQIRYKNVYLISCKGKW
jgi:hypothetical protein